MPLATSDLEFLGSTQLTSAVPTTATLTILPREMLFIIADITGYSGNDIASLRFNGDAGNNYWDRHMTSAAGTTSWTNVQTANTSLIRLAGDAVTPGRTIHVFITNNSSVAKPAVIHTQTRTANATTVGIVDIGGGQWNNTATQITTVLMVTAGGANFSVGSGFMVLGKDF